MSSDSMSSESSSESPPVTGTRQITLTPYFQQTYIEGYTHGFRLRIEVTDTNAMEPEIFRYYEYPIGLDGLVRQEFTGVCSWPDYETWPKDTPNPTDCPKTFRLSYVDIVLPSAQLADEAWAAIQQEAHELVTTLNAGDTLVVGLPFTTG